MPDPKQWPELTLGNFSRARKGVTMTLMPPPSSDEFDGAKRMKELLGSSKAVLSAVFDPFFFTWEMSHSTVFEYETHHSHLLGELLWLQECLLSENCRTTEEISAGESTRWIGLDVAGWPTE
ncbi:hypothetical protein MUK42_30407 [Musa troglodytarum]|uniref:Uncharacterized protein n=1 Tax=Musa troglodytarum TaxID=320322 RepID=A0A9E7GMR4_9LILI|nr:hypothetical protein MUK42_30407 [Musa troglodytarum]